MLENISGLKTSDSNKNIFNKKKNLTPPINDIVTPYYDEKSASSAISNTGKAFVQQFQPAQTLEDFEKQLNGINWLKSEDIVNSIDYIKNSNEFKEQDFKTISTLFNKLEDVCPEMKEKINVQKVLESYEYNKVFYDVSKAVKDLNINQINKINPEILKKMDTTYPTQAYSIFFGKPVQEPELINKLYSLLSNDTHKRTLFNTTNPFTFNKEKLSSLIERVKYMNSIDENLIEKVFMEALIDSNQDNKKIKKVFEYLQSLPKESKENYPPEFIYNLLKNDYSYSIDAKSKQTLLGTDKHVPAKTKNELKQELATFRNDDCFLFSNNQIDKIVSNENDIGELSKIINIVKKDNIKLNGTALEELLTREGITSEILEPNFKFIQEIRTNPRYADVKEIFDSAAGAYQILNTKINNEQINKNTALINVIKNNSEELLKAYKQSPSYILKLLTESHADKDTLEELLKSNLFQSINPSYINQIMQNSTVSNIRNAQMLRDNPKLAFVFDNYKNDQMVFHIFNKMPKNFDTAKKQDIIDFLADLKADPKSKDFISKYDTAEYLNILFKDSNDTSQEGKKLLQKLKEHNIMSSRFLTEQSFADSYNLLSRLEKNPELMTNYLSGYISILGSLDIDTINKITDVLEHSLSKESLKDTYFKFSIFRDLPALLKENGFDNYEFNTKQYKSNIDKLDDFSKLCSPEVWDSIKFEALKNCIGETSPVKDYIPENLEYLNDFCSNEKFKKLGIDIDVNSFLKEKLDIKSLKQNQSKIIETLSKYKSLKSNVSFNTDKLVQFTGNIDSLLQTIDNIIASYPTDNIDLYLNPYSNQVKLNIINRATNNVTTFMHDYNMTPLFSETTDFSTNKSGNTVVTRTHTDFVNNVKHKIIETEDKAFEQMNTPKEITSTYYDTNGKPIKTRFYSESAIDGVFNIKELTPDGKIKTICSATRSEDGIFVSKNLENLDGTKSNVFYHQDNLGNEDYTYKIIDKDGKELLNHNRSTKIIDSNNIITTVNGKEYKIKYSDKLIEVIDSSSKTKHIIDLSKLNPANSKTLDDMLHSLSGDELLDVQKYVKEFELTNRIESGMHPLTKKMYIGPHKFIMEHELGHAKDAFLGNPYDVLKEDLNRNFDTKIASDKKLQEIFYEELAQIKEKTSICIQDFASYFFKGEGEHYAGKLGGLRETIAETNAIQTTPKFHPLLQIRTQILQEYMPKTIAYLIKHKL